LLEISRSERIALTQNTAHPWLVPEVIGWMDSKAKPFAHRFSDQFWLASKTNHAWS